ncbi:MAG: T9SS type A sorting domain-containing protein [Bacteroidota bacterium]
MKKIFCTLLPALFFLNSYSQPVIDKSDMPVVSDTIRLSITDNDNGIDYTLTDADYTWDFSTLTEQSQRVDTFVSVTTVPLLYQIDFNNPLDTTHKASVAQPQPDITQLPNVQFTEVYDFFRASDYTYTQVGRGAKVNSIPTPIKYNDPDLLYTFPLIFGASDSSEYEYHLDIPNLGYYGETKKRVNVVDGWGTLITPFDTFPAIRVFSTSYIHDTIYMDTLGMGFAQDRTELEYKWLADTIGLPALRVIKRSGGGNNVSLEYKHKFPAGSGISDFPYTLTFFSLYPNPADASSKLYFALANPSHVTIDILDATCRKIYCVADRDFPKGFSSVDSGSQITSLSKGMYFIKINAGSNFKTLKILVQ